MPSIKRLDRLDVGAADIDDAISVYRRNFNLTVNRAADGKSAAVTIGGAQISLIPAAAQNEGMTGLWLEADDIDPVCAALSKAGCGFKPVRTAEGRRIVELDPQSANLVPLFIFDRKG